MNIGDAFGTFVGKELPSVIWNMFACISDERQDNYIAGFQTADTAVCIRRYHIHKNLRVSVHFRQAIRRTLIFITCKAKSRLLLFGEGDLHENDYGLTHLAGKLLTENVDKPRIFHACGGKDPWLMQNHILRDYFTAHPGFDYTYDEIPELGHEWKFWNEELKRFLDFLHW